MEPLGGIALLEALNDDIMTYLGQIQSLLDGKSPIDTLLLIGTLNISAERPKIWAIYEQMQREGHFQLVTGGFFDQPYLLSRALDVCREAEAEIDRTRQLNELAEQQNQKAKVLPFDG